MIKCNFAFFKIIMVRNIVGIFVLMLLLSSCASREKLQYYQGIEKAFDKDSSTYNPILKQDDLLLIIVSAPNPEAAKPFNLTPFSVSGAASVAIDIPDAETSQVRYQSYLIDNQGFISFPVLGQLALGGLSRADAIMLLKSKLEPYLKDPMVTIRILNYKITVQGEVERAGVFSISTERVTLPEALTMAGDLTIYAKRDNILIIRDVDGKKSYNFVDITKADFINSPFYYLSQNDVVYVEPNQTKMNSSIIGANLGVILTSASLLITIIALLIR
jgi:polysaccharide export outer membrane protein